MKRILILLLFFIPSLGFSQDLTNYLILNDIGGYNYRPKGTTELYGNSGVLISADHFIMDHDDITYATRYIHPETITGVSVQVTQHVGGDSDKWLFHEVERGFRGTDDREGRLGMLHKGSRLADINNNKVLRYWSTYRWTSNYVVIVIDYGDPREPEPLEIVQAYLQKFPSTIPANLVLDKAHNEKWIKDEIERRLWLCDKWFQQLDEGKTEQYKALSAVVDHDLEVFLDYREKYYGMGATQEKKILYGHLQALNDKEIRNKLTEYKQWWTENKTKPINLP